MLSSVCPTLTRNCSRRPWNRPVSGGSLTYSITPSRTQFQNCLGETQTLPSWQMTFADRLLVLAIKRRRPSLSTPRIRTRADAVGCEKVNSSTPNKLQDHIMIFKRKHTSYGDFPRVSASYRTHFSDAFGRAAGG